MPYNEKQKKWTMDYLSKLKEIRFRVKPEEYERYLADAHNAGFQSLRPYIIMVLDEAGKKFEKK